MTVQRQPSALESVARLRTMRALLAGEDRVRFERLVSDLEQAVCEMDGVTRELVQLIDASIAGGSPEPLQPVELSAVIASALRGVDPLMVSRRVTLDIEAPGPVFALGDRERLEDLIGAALTITASATTPGGRARLRFELADESTIVCRVTPYYEGDPRAPLVSAMARSQGVRLQSDEAALTLLVPAAMGAESV